MNIVETGPDGKGSNMRILATLLYCGVGVVWFAYTIPMLGEIAHDVCAEMGNRWVVNNVKKAGVDGLTAEIAPAPIKRWRKPLYAALVWSFVLLVIGPAFMMKTHTWNYWEALYFVFVTMTSIGFGDYFPNNEAAVNRHPGKDGPQVVSSSVAVWLQSVDFILVALVSF